MGVECYKIEQRKGRKEYICQLCGEKIRKGREYICESGRYDGEFFEHKRHIHCDALFNAYFDHGGRDLRVCPGNVLLLPALA